MDKKSNIEPIFPREHAPPSSTMPPILAKVAFLLETEPTPVYVHVLPPIGPIGAKRWLGKAAKFPLMEVTDILWYCDDEEHSYAEIMCEWKAVLRVHNAQEAVEFKIIKDTNPDYVSVCAYQIAAIAEPETILERIAVDL